MNVGSTRLLQANRLAGAAAAAGLALASGYALTRGGIFGLLLVAGATVVALFILVTELRHTALMWWAVLSPLLYPFVRLPANQPYFTFDRLWLGAMLAGLVAIPGKVYRSNATRLFLVALVWLAAAYVIRSFFTPSSYTGYIPVTLQDNLRVAFDALILPIGIFVAVNRWSRTERRCHQYAAALAIGGGVLATIGIAQRVLGFELASRTGGEVRLDESVVTSAGSYLLRVSGPYPDPEPYALGLLLCLAATLYWVQARRGTTWLPGLLLIGVQLTAIGLTFFRVAWIAALIIVVAAFGIRPKRAGRLFVVVGLVAAVTVVAVGQLRATSEEVSQRLDNSRNAYSRAATYQAGIDMFRRDPLTGVGVNQFSAAVSTLPTVSGVRAEPVPHSSYIGMAAEQGLWGLVPLLVVTGSGWYLIRTLRRTTTSRSDTLLVAAATGAAIAYILMSVTLTMLPYAPSNWFFAVLLGMVAARVDANSSEEARA